MCELECDLRNIDVETVLLRNIAEEALYMMVSRTSNQTYFKYEFCVNEKRLPRLGARTNQHPWPEENLCEILNFFGITLKALGIGRSR